MTKRIFSRPPETELQFAALGLPIGQILTIETLSPVRKYVVRLLGFSEGKSLLVSAPYREGKEVLLEKHSMLAVRLLEGKKICAFEARVIYRSIQPYTYYHLSYPVQVETLQVRDSERVDTQIEAVVDSDFDIVGEWPKPAQINNMSKTGARMMSDQFLGTYGHELLVDFDLRVSGMNKRVCLSSIVRNIEKDPRVPGDDASRYIIGVQFLDMTDDVRMSLANYIYEHDQRI